jgi:hypothetical protein
LPNRSWARPLPGALLLGAVAGLTTALVHGEIVGYGFDYDDYYFLRPHAIEDVAATFHGPWDLTGVMVKFYRPLTVAFSALRFELFGLNAVAHHVVSLALFATAATLTALLLRRITRRFDAALLGTLFVVVHPAMPYSLVAWITNQMHLLQTLVVLAALLWWDTCRARRLTWWIPLMLFAIVSFLIKEDGVMLLPAIVVLHEIRRRTVEPGLRRTPIVFAVSSVILLIALMKWRTFVLGELGGYARPTVERAWLNLSGVLWGVARLLPADRPWQPAASWFVTLLPAAALVSWKWISMPERFCLAGGAALAVLFALPFVFVVKPEQVYMLGLGFAIVLTGGSLGLLDVAARVPRPGLARLAVAALIAGGLTTLVAVTRHITRDFEPFSPIVLAHDDIVRTWGFVPLEIREYVARKREPGAETRMSSNPVDEVPVVTFNTHGPDTTPDGVPYMWMAGRGSEIYLPGSARTVTIPLRHAIEAFREPVHVRIEADGRLVDELDMKTSEWRHSTIALRRADVSPLRRQHRIRITIERVWRPSEVIPGSSDGRLLGLQVGTPIVR